MATKIVVDAGHGGSNPGATYQGRRESDDALRLAMAVGQILEENGYDVIYTRTSDVSQRGRGGSLRLDPPERGGIPRKIQWRPDPDL